MKKNNFVKHFEKKVWLRSTRELPPKKIATIFHDYVCTYASLNTPKIPLPQGGTLTPK